jgi:hypothetical protein
MTDGGFAIGSKSLPDMRDVSGRDPIRVGIRLYFVKFTKMSHNSTN